MPQNDLTCNVLFGSIPMLATFKRVICLPSDSIPQLPLESAGFPFIGLSFYCLDLAVEPFIVLKTAQPLPKETECLAKQPNSSVHP